MHYVVNNVHTACNQCFFFFTKCRQQDSVNDQQYSTIIQGGARKTGPPSRRQTWVWVSDCVQEIKQMQITYWFTAELHCVYDNMLQRAQKCIDVQDHFQQLL